MTGTAHRSGQGLLKLPVFLELGKNSLLGCFGDGSEGKTAFASEPLADIVVEEEFLDINAVPRSTHVADKAGRYRDTVRTGH